MTILCFLWRLFVKEVMSDYSLFSVALVCEGSHE